MASQTPHTSGLFADMSLDGPAIGTLVIVFDRAKNLPNRKSMGKQNPYCAARLGKYAQKTETDRRGGQTPRWDQELRFVVHDSPDYCQRLKVSVFSEDKRTDLIGEAWIDLTQVIVPGGGKSDLWQNLTFKGKYAGELRIELTYYDERPKPAETPSSQDLAQSIMGDSLRVKRRPLPSNPHLRNLTPDTIPEPAAPGRAKHGPRDFKTPPRANSMPPEINYSQPQPVYAAPQPAHPQSHGNSPAHQTPSYAPYRPQDDTRSQHNGPYELPDFLPQLPPSNRSRGSLPMLQPQRFDAEPEQMSSPYQQRDPGLQHSYSSPAVPTTYQQYQDYDDGPQLRTDFSEPIPDVEYQHQQLLLARPRSSEAMPSRRNQYPDPYNQSQMFREEGQHAPPPPPVHSNSSPAVPQRSSGHPISSPVSSYNMTPPSARHHSIPTSSPLQNLERKYMTPPRPQGQGSPPVRGSSFDSYTSSPEPLAYGSSPVAYTPGQTPSPHFRPQQAPRSAANRHSIADPYYAGTPPRPHPLSKEVSQTHSPPHLQGSSPQNGPSPGYQPQYRTRDGLPLIKPRPVSPQASSQPPSQPSSVPQSRSLYEIQYPIRAFESSDKSPLSTSHPNARASQVPNGSTPIRKSISPHPTPASAGAVPYSPDSFNIHNPNSQSPLLSNGNSPHSPYQIRPGSEGMPQDMTHGPIMDSHGNEIDPSDRLPINSWAPEPEKKTPTRTYGVGRDRDFGPRNPQSAEAAGGKNLSKDTVVNFRSRAQTQPSSGEPTSFRNRLQKKTTPTTKSPGAIQPLQERHNYNSTYTPSSDADRHYGGAYGQPWEQNSYGGSYAEMSDEALSREISSIDIGGGRHVRSDSVPSPTAYVPVRSHKDRRAFY